MLNPKLELQKSYFFAGSLLGLHLAACVCLFFVNLPTLIIISLMLVNVASFSYTTGRYALLLYPDAIRQAWVNDDGLWSLESNDGSIQQARLRGDSVMTRRLGILNFSVSQKRWLKTIIICPDTMDAMSFRRLKVYLTTYKNKLS